MKMTFLNEEFDEKEFNKRKLLRESKEVNYDIPAVTDAWNSINSAIKSLREVPLNDIAKCNQVIQILWTAQDMISTIYDEDKK